MNIHWKNGHRSCSSNTLATWFVELSHWKILMLGKFEGRKRQEWERVRCLDGVINSLHGHEFEQSLGDGEGQGSLVQHAAVHGFTKRWTPLSDWTTLKDQDAGPRKLRCIGKEWFQWAQMLAILRGRLTSLIWDIWLTLLNNNLLIARLPAPWSKLLYGLTCPHPQGNSSLRVT